MNLVFQAAETLQQLLRERGWGFCFIGGLAVQHWGEPRVTRDVDVTLLTGFGGEEPFVRALLTRFQPRVAEPDFWDKALRYRVALLQHPNGVGVDVALGALPFEERAVKRAVEVTFLGDWKLRLCSVEDLVVMKSFASRERDWLDVKTILIRRGRELDWSLILTELRPLAELKEAPEIVEQLERFRRQLIVP